MAKSWQAREQAREQAVLAKAKAAAQKPVGVGVEFCLDNIGEDGIIDGYWTAYLDGRRIGHVIEFRVRYIPPQFRDTEAPAIAEALGGGPPRIEFWGLAGVYDGLIHRVETGALFSAETQLGVMAKWIRGVDEHYREARESLVNAGLVAKP